ncbi:MAG: hypothetical protein FWE62_06625 [Firmicutes bacterium]|nr:hypothetical protein [Bacillota bacterium]
MLILNPKEVNQGVMADPVHRCPHCGKCIALAFERDECVSVAFHKDTPSRRPDVVQLLAKRRCARPDCKKDFIVECYAPIRDLLRWLILKRPDALAREFEGDSDLIKALRQDKKLMALITGGEDGNIRRR